MKTNQFTTSIRIFLCLIGCTLFSTVNAQLIQISNEAELKAIASNLSGNYQLTNDITLTGEWTPIGNDKPFSGILYGNNHVIRNLKISDGSANVGLFARTYGALIQDLGIENAKVSAPNSKAAGIIIGHSTASYIENSYITDSEIEGNNVGSFIGTAVNRNINFSVISNSYSTANVKSGSSAGGIVGTSEGIYIESVYFAGSIDAATICGGITATSKGENSISGCVVLSPNLKAQETGKIIGKAGNDLLEINNVYAVEGNAMGVFNGTQEQVFRPDDSEINAKNPLFYQRHLYWESRFWDFKEGSYPTLLWQKVNE